MFIRRKLLTGLVLIISIPLVVIIALAFLNYDNVQAPKLSISGISELLTPLRLNEILAIAGRSLVVSLVATLFSYCASYLLVRYSGNVFRSFFFVLITLPFLANESVRVFSWQYLLAENGVLNHFIQKATALTVMPFNGSNPSNVYFVMITACIPFGIFINSASITTIPKVVWSAANDLKLNHLAKFGLIALPLSTFGLLVSIIATFFISFSLSTEVIYLGGSTKMSMRNLVLSFMSASKFQAIFALGSLIIVVLLALTILSKAIVRQKHTV
jgi:spermidine/putrescine transport system permease protein